MHYPEALIFKNNQRLNHMPNDLARFQAQLEWLLEKNQEDFEWFRGLRFKTRARSLSALDLEMDRVGRDLENDFNDRIVKNANNIKHIVAIIRRREECSPQLSRYLVEFCNNVEKAMNDLWDHISQTYNSYYSRQKKYFESHLRP